MTSASVRGEFATYDVPLTAKQAIAESDRVAAFQLRYSVYIAEQGKPYPEADHERQLLTDELDEQSHIIVVSGAERESGIAGTVRASWFDAATTYARFAETFEIPRFAAFPTAEISVCSRLAASMEHRHARVRELLFESIYHRGLDRNTRLCFATCAPILLRMFRKYGFREFSPPLSDATVGKLHRTLLVLDDIEHLTRVGSPFCAIAQQRGIGVKPRPWLSQIFDEYRNHHGTT